jgi:hypothetical protein
MSNETTRSYLVEILDRETGELLDYAQVDARSADEAERLAVVSYMDSATLTTGDAILDERMAV